MNLPINLLTSTQADIERLITDQVQEGPHLDFKRDIPTSWNESAKHEFLADVTALANSGGGDLIFGVGENGNAQAEIIVPQALASADQEVRRLQDFLLNLVEPRLPGVQFHAITVSIAGTAGYVIVVRVPQSWAGPHRVKTNQHFFFRDGLRKRQLDIPEIKNLFLQSENQSQKIRDFRTERLGRIMSGEPPHPLVAGPVLVVHIIPTQAILGKIQIDPIPYAGDRTLPLMGTGGLTARLNVDGALIVRNITAQRETHGYSQFFRNGYFESTYVLTRRAGNDRAILPSIIYEQNLIRLLSDFRIELARLDINKDCVVMLSLTQANEVKLGVRDDFNFMDDHQTLFDRNMIVIPDVIALGETAPEYALKPVFDLVWQAAGLENSNNYNAAGAWVPQR